MKSYDPKKGWLVRCVDGPLDGGFIRSWCLQDTPESEAAALPHEFRMTINEDEKGTSWWLETRAVYRLEPALDKKGNQKAAKHKGATLPMLQYRWMELEPST